MIGKRKFIIWTGLITLILLVLTACGPYAVTRTSQSPEVVYTQAAATISAGMTLEAAQTIVVQATELASQPTATQTLPPTATPTQEPTATPTNTSTATLVPPTNTAQPPTPTPVPCNIATFVQDMTIPDGTEFEPNQSFTKTWRLKNVGTCTWQTSYDIVFMRGDRMDGGTTDLTTVVRPRETTDISVTLRSPGSEGKYTGYWALRDNNGVIFGIGQLGDKAFWVNINVKPRKQTFFDMTDKYCDATWTSASGALSCPGDANNASTGYVIRENKPQHETGSFDNEPALFVRVDESGQGYIQGRYPAFTVKSGDRFRAIIGCAFPNKNCNVQFELLYTLDGINTQSLGSWDEKNEGQFRRLDVDLSSLHDKTVTLILKVSNNSNSTDDVAYWLFPRVVR
jgi:hypothetical protein